MTDTCPTCGSAVRVVSSAKVIEPAVRRLAALAPTDPKYVVERTGGPGNYILRKADR